MKIHVGRPIEGIALNGLEWLLNKDGSEMTFESKKEAKDFLRQHGYTKADFEYLVFERN